MKKSGKLKSVVINYRQDQVNDYNRCMLSMIEHWAQVVLSCSEGIGIDIFQVEISIDDDFIPILHYVLPADANLISGTIEI